MRVDQSYFPLIQNRPVQAGPRLALLTLVVLAHCAAALALIFSPALDTIQRDAPEPLLVRLFEEAQQAPPPATAKTSPQNTATQKPASPETARPAPAPPARQTSASAAATPAPTPPAPTPPAPTSPATPASSSTPAPAATTAPAASASPQTTAPSAPAPAVRTGVSIDAAYAGSNPKPPYPPMARRLGEEGTVTLRILVSSDGQAARVEIKRSSGSSLLDKSAEETVKQWRFIPAKLDGKAVEEWYETRWTFKLEG